MIEKIVSSILFYLATEMKQNLGVLDRPKVTGPRKLGPNFGDGTDIRKTLQKGTL